LKQNTDTVIRTLHGWKTTRLIAERNGSGVAIYSEYLSGCMVPNGVSLLEMLQHGSMSTALAPGLFVGDPAAIGVTYTLESSHSPFLFQPTALSKVLIDIGVESLAEHYAQAR
jgi:hypothetical protein